MANIQNMRMWTELICLRIGATGKVDERSGSIKGEELPDELSNCSRECFKVSVKAFSFSL
jgi:hypothetical protein